MTSRNYTFTINMRRDESIDDFKLLRPSTDEIKYLVMGLEIAPTTGQIHWQGYLSFKEPQGWNKVKKAFGRNDLHVEKAKANAERNTHYCCKTGPFLKDAACKFPGVDPYIFGDYKDKRISVREQVVATLSEKGKVATICEHPAYMLGHAKEFEYYCNLLARNAVKNTEQERLLIYVHGETGVGKTWTILNAFAQGVYRLPHPDAQKKIWMDFYDPLEHEVLFIDEFDATEWNLNIFKELVDVYPMSCHTKGGFTKTNWNVCFVCSTVPFEAQKWEQHYDEIFRRFHLILHDVHHGWLGDVFKDLLPKMHLETETKYALWYLANTHTYLSYQITKNVPPRWYEIREPIKRAPVPVDPDDMPLFKRQAAQYLDPNGDGDGPDYPM